MSQTLVARHLRILLGGAVLAAASAVVYSSIPDANGVIHACYNNRSGIMSVIDSAASCRGGETRISWNVQGPPGPPGAKGDPGTPGTPGADGGNGLNGSNGADGVSVQSVMLAPGEDANCPNGGSKFVSTNGTTYACNGESSAAAGQMLAATVLVNPGAIN